MDILILNKKLDSESILDAFESLIWTDRFFKYGDFEIYTPATPDVFAKMIDGYYLWIRESEHTMIIESVTVDSDAEFGNNFIVTGRSLESILERRIVWKLTNLSGSLQNCVKKLINDAIISPTDESRKIPNFIFVESTDPAITDLTLDLQVPMGDNLYDTIVKICESKRIGFKVVLTDDGYFAFSLYAGQDRSYDQLANPYVVFSPSFENIINSNYLESSKKKKTVTLVGGEGDDTNRVTRTVAVEAGAGSGLDRREMFTDARHVQKETSEGTLTDAEYNAQLIQEGQEDLAENKFEKLFEGECDTTNTFVYDKDFFMGDIVQVKNEYGAESKSRVIEFIRSEDPNGKKAYPTFEIVE